NRQPEALADGLGEWGDVQNVDRLHILPNPAHALAFRPLPTGADRRDHFHTTIRTSGFLAMPGCSSSRPSRPSLARQNPAGWTFLWAGFPSPRIRAPGAQQMTNTAAFSASLTTSPRTASVQSGSTCSITSPQ